MDECPYQNFAGCELLLVLLVFISIFSSCSPNSGTDSRTPGSFTLLTPQDQSTEYTAHPILTWEKPNDPDSVGITYNVYLDTQNPPLNLIQINIEGNEYTIQENLNPKTTYYWQIEAVNKAYQKRKSESVYSFTTSSLTAIIANENIGELSRTGHSIVVFDDKLWMFAGSHGRYWKQDVWSSDDGFHWSQATDEAGYISRQDHSSFVYDDKIWMIGGSVLGGFHMDVWSTEDGINWQQVTNDAPFNRRVSHTSVVFNDKMWVIAGNEISKDLNNTYERNDIWYSQDGINWIQATDSAAFHSRSHHVSVVFDKKMWVIGGATSSDQESSFDVLKDVWYSENGVDWTMATNDAGFGDIYYMKGAVYDGKIWLVGGIYKDRTTISDKVWYSSDGVNWTEAEPFFGRYSHDITVFKGKIWGVGGAGANNPEYTDSWYLELP